MTIITKYHGPTKAKCSRVSATGASGRVYVAWDSALGETENHREALEAYLMSITGRLGGRMIDDYTPATLKSGAVAWVYNHERVALRGVVEAVKAGDRSGNPYMKPWFKEALAALGDK